jgi:glycosyltransferase involved in cell wall biosynthesis
MKITFLRTNFFWFEQQSGGSVSHIAGFVAGLEELGHTVNFISTDKLKKIDEKKMPISVIMAPGWQKRLPYLGELFYNFVMIPRAKVLLKKTRPDFLYQRHSILNVTGAIVSRRLRLPFVIEYNSPEGWKLRHWTKTSPFKHKINLLIAAVVDALERFALRRAHLIVVVSQALKDRLVEQGFSPEKILANPNGVELTEFDAVKPVATYTEKGKLLIGFVGTFAHWHGAEVLCRSVKEVHAKNPNARFVLIGDGVFRAECESIIAKDNLQNTVAFTGTVDHHTTIGILKSCDVLVSPHVPNADGTPFFGSPTKLFEYMAAGKCIVASDLFQVGEIIREHDAGITVAPGDVKSLSAGIVKALADSALRARLGKNARKAAETDYTWKANAQRVIDVIKPLIKEA